MADVVKSIFRQREIEKLYELYYYGGWYSLNRFKREESVGLSTISNTKQIISDKVIGTYDIEIPMLEIGDEFFLHDINEVVKVKNKMRSSDGSITYYVEDKVVETENTRKTYAECRKKIEHWNHEQSKFDDLKQRIEELEEYKKEYKYKHRFFNKKADD